jgi:hypothetical protein
MGIIPLICLVPRQNAARDGLRLESYMEMPNHRGLFRPSDPTYVKYGGFLEVFTTIEGFIPINYSGRWALVPASAPAARRGSSRHEVTETRLRVSIISQRALR